jgi:DNA repair protein RadA/Sms
MAKAKRQYVCSSCGHTEPRWFGVCPSCGDGGTAEEAAPRAERANRPVARGAVPSATFKDLNDVSQAAHQRTNTGLDELDRVLGGGLVPGSYVVLAGEPGAGKTTLSTELLIHLSALKHKVAYISGEESEAQARMRFERLGARLGQQELLISTETSVERVCQAIEGNGFDLVVVDSIQTMFSESVPGAPGSVSQVRESGQQLMRSAKETGTSVLLVGQVTKGGDMAGPRTLEHMVDVVLAFEGDRREQYRILRSVKNRFGSTDEIGVFEMTGSGLKGISDPSELFVSDHDTELPGTALAVVMEGTRPVLCEIQALVSTSNLPQPIRAARGLDRNRAQMLLAVLSRKAGLRLGSMDVYINVSGGLKVDEPAADLAICLAVMSAYQGRPVKDRICAFGEVSLLGTIRSAPQAERRHKEAGRLNYRPLEIEKSLRNTLEKALGPATEAAAIEDEDED